MEYLLSNICTKNYWNRTTIVEIIGGGWVVSFFETQCINNSSCAIFRSTKILLKWLAFLIRLPPEKKHFRPGLVGQNRYTNTP